MRSASLVLSNFTVVIVQPGKRIGFLFQDILLLLFNNDIVALCLFFTGGYINQCVLVVVVVEEIISPETGCKAKRVVVVIVKQRGTLVTDVSFQRQCLTTTNPTDHQYAIDSVE